MKTTLSIVFCFIFMISSSFKASSPRVSFDKQVVKRQISEFFSAFKTYANSKNKNQIASSHIKIDGLFEGSEFPHIDDLPNGDASDTKELQIYLNAISNEYNNQLKVNFSNLEILDCEETKSGIRFATASFTKETSYKGKVKTYQYVAKFNLNTSPPKINMILLAEESNKCSIDTENKVLTQLKENAEKLFEASNFEEASAEYQKYLDVEFDMEILAEKAKCDSRINAQVFEKKGDDFADNKKFDEALEQYTQALSWYEESQVLPNKIEFCKVEIEKMKDPCYANKDEYVLAMNSAEESFSDRNYDYAKSQFEKALDLCDLKKKKYIQSKIASCKENIAIQKIKKQAEFAINKGNYAQAKSSYELLLKKYPNDIDAIRRIQYCNNEIKRLEIERKHKQLIVKGDAANSAQEYSQAIKYYNESMVYTSDTRQLSIVQRKISQAKSNRIVTARREIERARNYISSKKLPEAMAIYVKHENSGLLSANDYYLMARIMDMAYKNVRKKLGYSKRHCYIKARYYCISSMDRGNRKAQDMWSNHFNGRARRK